jgi:hypothetical protein
MSTQTPSTVQHEGFTRMTLDYDDIPETPPAHIWAYKAIKHQLLGINSSPVVPVEGTDEPEEENVRSMYNGADGR